MTGANFRVERVWYERVTGEDIERDEARLVLKTGMGDFSQFLGKVGEETFQRARRLAERLGVPLVMERGLRDRVDGWRQMEAAE